MAGSRLKIVAKLSLLIGLPVAAVTTLFCGGVYFGATHRHGITEFERDWLRMDVEVPDPPPAVDKPTEPEPETKTETPSPQESPPQPVAQPTPTPTPTPAQPVQADATPQPQPSQPQPAAVAQPEPLQGDLAARLALPVTVQVKVLVDQDLITARPDWIDHVQRTVSSASQVYQTHFGIELELVSVGRWPVATAGMSVEELHEELRTRPREGADVLVALTNRPLDGTISGRADIPLDDSPKNGGYAVVYASPRRQNPHLRTFVHELAHLFGALDITEPSHPDWQAGSWMSYAPVQDGSKLWIDRANRERVLARKDRPFAPEPGGN